MVDPGRARPSSRFRLVLRAVVIASLVGMHGLRWLAGWLFLLIVFAGKARRRAWFGQNVLDLFRRLGATFIKVGQIASTRGDLLPRALVEELATLQDRVPAFDFADVRRTIEAELGRPLEEVYDRFEREPVAAASVAQVHRAVLRSSGATVAVKVRRPDVLEKVRLDRTILMFVGRTLERLVPTVRLMALEGALRAFCDAVAEQIHFENEARNNARFSANFADDPDIDFPRLPRF